MPRAERDIYDVVVGLRRKAPLAAARWHARLLAAIGRLEFMPTRFGRVDELARPGEELREYIFGKKHGAYRVIYNVTAQTVHVLRVVHASHGPLTLDDLT